MSYPWTRSEIAAAAAIAAAALFFFFFDIGALPYRDYDEATYADVIAEGLETERFLPLSLHGEERFDKPPPHVVAAMALSKLFGFSEGVARFPSSLLGVLSIVLPFA